MALPDGAGGGGGGGGMWGPGLEGRFQALRHAELWLPARLRAAYEPLACLAVAAWLTWTPDPSKLPAWEAGLLGALLSGPFLLAVALLAWGLAASRAAAAGSEGPAAAPAAWGLGRLPWHAVQKLELLPVLLCSALVVHWARIVDKLLYVPVWGLLYEIGFAVSTQVRAAAVGGRTRISARGLSPLPLCSCPTLPSLLPPTRAPLVPRLPSVVRLSPQHLVDPAHALLAQVIIWAHYAGTVGYVAATDPIWASKNTTAGPGGNLRWLEPVVIFIGILFVDVVLYGGAMQIESVRRELHSSQEAALEQRDTAVSLVSNFLPPPVIAIMQRGEGRDGSESLAWGFDHVCVLQSDIVSFTSLGGRISAEQLW